MNNKHTKVDVRLRNGDIVPGRIVEYLPDTVRVEYYDEHVHRHITNTWDKAALLLGPLMA